ncbi:MAG: hypothetical protein E6Q44_16590 [Flavobacteriales bacterium]|jgi:hypothetical protein|nr:MAG: hypothetical protein E6Q44_16590 [Flavobacteriales bacterium]
MRGSLPSIIGACFVAHTGHAQQLVPNPSFEAVTSCPTFASQLDHAAPWVNPTQGTPELYHACAGSGAYAGVPANYSGGYQLPRTGDGFAGLYTYRNDIANMREFIAAPLLQPLEAGQCYRFRMFLNMPNDFSTVCDGVGVHFSEGPVTANHAGLLPVTAHIAHPAGQVILDTLGWTEVSGFYTAVGGEDHLTIGNFRSDVQSTVAYVNTDAWYQGQAYLLVDDVSLEPIMGALDLGGDTLVCGGGTITLNTQVPGATAVLWNDGLTDPVRTVTQAGRYTVEVHLGTCVLRDTIAVDIRPWPSIDLGLDRSICSGTGLLLQAITDAESQVIWSDGTHGHSRIVQEPGVYSAIASNTCGSRTDMVTVSVEECPEDIYLPNAITPDGDGINDRFIPVYDPRLWEVSFRIHDRWGRVCYEAVDGAAWAADDAPVGVYAVDLTARSRVRPGHQERRQGHITLIR